MAVGAEALPLRNRFDTGPVLLVVAMVLWGATFVITRAALDDIGAFTILAARFSIAFLCLLPFALRDGFSFRLVTSPIFVVFGLTGIVIHNGLETVGLRFTTAGSAALVIAAIPAITAAMSIAFLNERPTRRQWFGIALSIIGVALIASTKVEGGGSLQLLGNLLVLGGVIAWAVYTIQGKRLTHGYSGLVSTTAGFGAAVLFLIPLSVGEVALTGAPILTGGSAAGILYLGLGASAAAYALWNRALHHVDATVAAPYVNLVPVIGLALAIATGESTTATQLTGGGIVLLGVWMSNSTARTATL